MPLRITPAARAVLLLAACTAGPVAAASLSFSEALALAVSATPALRMTAAQIDAARQAAIPAGALPDPKLSLGVDNLPTNGPDRYRLTEDFMTMRRVGVMQEFPNRAKRRARVERADGEVAVAEAESQITRQLVLRETAVAWIARASVEQQLAYIDALLEENRLFEAAVRAQIAGGKSPATDVVAPRQEAALIDGRADELVARRDQAMAALRRWVGASADAPLSGTAPDWPIADDVLKHALHRHPELMIFDSKLQVLDAEVAAAVATRKPDWALELAYQERGSQFSDMAMVQVTFDLPLFAASRQNPRIAARRAARVALDAEREAALREHTAMLETDLAEYRRLARAVTRQRTVLVPLAREKVQLASAAWRGANGGLMEVIAARRERIDAELEAIALDGARQQLAARLHYAYAAPSAELVGEQP
ncbi:TolC family protein [Immundisolibacter sp.]|uniref:TolC family protein n=1 Tax=Immundisolibacter sp. TaxID=1934948 RepID=UPI00356B29BF